MAVVFAAILSFAGFASNAQAQDAPAPPEARDWDASLSLYGWLLSLHGDAVVRGQPVGVDVGFDTILENLDFAIMGTAHVHYKDFGFFLDGVYGKVSADGATSRGPLGVQAGVTTNLLYLTFGAGYRFDPIELGPSPLSDENATVTLEPFIGGRYYSIRFATEVAATLAPITIGPRGRFTTRPRFVGRRAETDISFIDPVIGLKTEWNLTDSWVVNISGDVGGFGVGSDFSWDALGTIGYRFGIIGERDALAFAGYRANGVDYKTTNARGTAVEWNIITRGPVVGLKLNF